MKRIFIVLINVIIFSAFLYPKQAADSLQTQSGSEPYAGQVLCLPGAFNDLGGDCVPLGPSKVLSELAKIGLTIPETPLPTKNPDPTLTDVSYHFARLNVEWPDRPAFYSSPLDASTGSNPIGYLPAGRFLYISYINRSIVNGKQFVQIYGGGWLRASPTEYSKFQGLVFQKNPRNSFGWIIDLATPKTSPDINSPSSSGTIPRETLVQIYDVVEAYGRKWYMIGLNQWVERSQIRQVSVNPVPPKGVDNSRWIEVNLYEQTLTVYEQGNLLFATLIATGAKPYYTQPGLFKISKKTPAETMTGAFEADKSDYYFLQDVPWTMYFDKSRALHGAYWRALFGYPQSPGCVNLSIGDSRWLYDWAREGDWVYVVDPSGMTPTDPALYTQGGA